MKNHSHCGKIVDVEKKLLVLSLKGWSLVKSRSGDRYWFECDKFVINETDDLKLFQATLSDAKEQSIERLEIYIDGN
jgi:hypothetical protein